MSDTIVIRPARTRDLTAIFRLLSEPELQPPNHPREDRAWIRDHLRRHQIVLVAVRQQRIVGFVMGEVATSHVAILHLIAVATAWRRRGIATRLFAAFERAAWQRRGWCILTYIHADSMLTSRWMTRHGYAAGAQVREYQKFLQPP